MGVQMIWSFEISFEFKKWTNANNWHFEVLPKDYTVVIVTSLLDINTLITVIDTSQTFLVYRSFA